MATRIYVSNIEAEFFTTNTLDCKSGIPIKGYHKVGDIVISSTQKNAIFGWVCVVEGEPGEWQSIRNTGNWLDIKLEEINERFSRIEITNNNTNETLILLREEFDTVKKGVQDNKASINLINNELEIIKNNNEIIERLEDAVETNANDIIETNKNVSKNAIDIAALAELISDGNETNTNNLGTLSNKIQANTEAIIEISGDVEENNNNIIKINTDIETINNEINILKDVDKTHTEELNGIDEHITELTENIASNTKAIEDLNTYHKEKEEMLSSITENIASNTKAIEDLNIYHEEKEIEIATIVEDVESNSKSIEDLIVYNEEKEEVITNITEDVANNSKSIEELTKNIEDTKNEIDELKNAIKEVLIENGKEVTEEISWKDLLTQLISINKVENPEEPEN